MPRCKQLESLVPGGCVCNHNGHPLLQIWTLKKSQLFIWIFFYSVCHLQWPHHSPPTKALIQYGVHTFQACLLWGSWNRLIITEFSGKVNKNTEWVKVLATACLKICMQWLREITCKPLETWTIYPRVERSDDEITVIYTHTLTEWLYIEHTEECYIWKDHPGWERLSRCVTGLEMLWRLWKKWTTILWCFTFIKQLYSEMVGKRMDVHGWWYQFHYKNVALRRKEIYMDREWWHKNNMQIPGIVE